LNLAQHLRTIPGAERIADQISRCGPSIQFNYAESQAASSRTHFIAIIETAEREARETQADGEAIMDAEYVKPSRLVDLYTESGEIVAILTTIAKNAKENLRKEKQKKKARS
jgi:four helix bundle protein